MSETIYLGVVMMCVQLGSVYLLYLPFSRDVTAEQKKPLATKIFAVERGGLRDELIFLRRRRELLRIQGDAVGGLVAVFFPVDDGHSRQGGATRLCLGHGGALVFHVARERGHGRHGALRSDDGKIFAVAADDLPGAVRGVD